MLKLATFFFTPGGHAHGWRHPDADPGSDMDFSVYVAMAQAAERGKIDAIFFADSSAVPGSNSPEVMASGKFVTGRICYLEPATLITALAPVTKNIGLITTITTTYNEPYNVARRMASLDHISGGRAGWNLVTSQHEEAAGNFGDAKHVDHALRYERGSEFSDVLKALWDSWEEEAHIRDKATGQTYDPTKVHMVNHKGKYFSVRGPLNVVRPPQGHPVIAEAGSSEPGKELAARAADIVFTAQPTLGDGQTFYSDVKGRLARYGRDPESLKILPGVLVIVAPTDQEAQRRRSELDEMMDIGEAMKLIQRFAGDVDLSKFPLDGPLPDLPTTINAARGRQKVLIDMARHDNLTLGQVAKRFTSTYGHRVLCGSPKTIADDFELWHREGAADGFVIMFPFFPKPLYDFVDMVIPELQRRGLFRTEYEGATLRENLGIPKPPNQYLRAAKTLKSAQHG